MKVYKVVRSILVGDKVDKLVSAIITGAHRITYYDGEFISVEYCLAFDTKEHAMSFLRVYTTNCLVFEAASDFVTYANSVIGRSYLESYSREDLERMIGGSLISIVQNRPGTFHEDIYCSTPPVGTLLCKNLILTKQITGDPIV